MSEQQRPTLPEKTKTLARCISYTLAEWKGSRKPIASDLPLAVNTAAIVAAIDRLTAAIQEKQK